MRKFQVGDKVKIKPESMYYGRSYSNPKDEIGIVKEIRAIKHLEFGVFPVVVRWKDSENAYYPHDLDLVTGMCKNVNAKKKTKQAPPKRKKTDAVVVYSNGATYTLKNVESLYINKNATVITVGKNGFRGVKRSEILQLSDVKEIVLKTPSVFYQLSITEEKIFVENKEISTASSYFMWTEKEKS